ncbi:MAG: hypothetical protein KGZ88_12345 [Methylomicrobium sp.]|nr:hypothetical protein [Methylomicrobium sp.]
MRLIILQTILKQWDKNELTDSHSEKRSSIPDQFCIKSPPATFTVDQKCLIDHHRFGSFETDLIFSQYKNTSVRFSSFKVNLNECEIESEGSTSQLVLNKWFKFRYLNRRRVLENNLYFWLYEEITLNAILLNHLDPSVFLQSSPYQTIEVPGLNQNLKR